MYAPAHSEGMNLECVRAAPLSRKSQIFTLR